MENSTEQSQKSKDVFMTMVGLLGLNAEVSDKVSGRNIVLSVNTDEPGRLIGRNGSSLDNVGLLMNRILKKTDNSFPKVIIDVDGYDKKSKRDKRKTNNRKDRRAKSSKIEKTTVMTESSTEDSINVYVDHETDTLDPVTTVALDSDNRREERRPQQRRGGRDNNRRDNRRDNNRDNNRRGRNNDRRSRSQQIDKSAINEEAKPVEQQEQSSSSSSGKPNKLQMQCRNAAKEVKRWGEDILLPPLSENDCNKAMDYFKSDNEVNVTIDNSRSYGDKKRVRISLKG